MDTNGFESYLFSSDINVAWNWLDDLESNSANFGIQKQAGKGRAGSSNRGVRGKDEVDDDRN
jgi:hypothetical protein